MHSINFYLFNLLFSFSHQFKWLDFLIVVCAKYIAYFVVVAVICAIYYAWSNKKNNEAILYILAFFSAGVGRVIAEGIRFFYHHMRPPTALNILPLFSETSYSFPSGHAVFFFALAMGVYFAHKKFGRILFVVAVIIGVSRVMAGVHWPFDILAGAILGIGVALVFYKLWVKFGSNSIAYIRSCLGLNIKEL